jgi:hypothetical protein
MTSAHALPKGRFTAVLADPPWNFRNRSPKGRNRCPDRQGHYKVMKLDDIMAAGRRAHRSGLRALPLGRRLQDSGGTRRRICVGIHLQDRRFHLGENHQGLGRVAPPWWSDAREMRDRAAGRDGLRLLADASDEILVIYRLRRSSGQLTRLRRNRLPQPKRGVRNV